jgi:CubicO group peptidase (beta-lactamase class C family)
MQDVISPEKVGLSSTRLGRLRPWIQGYLDAGKLPGAVIFVARHGRPAYRESFGHADLQNRSSMTTDTIFRLYSMTKPVTAVALLMLYEEGRFQLDDPVAEFIPGFEDLRVYVSGEGDEMVTEPLHMQVTLHHLLTHTSGLTYGFGNEGPVAALYRKHHTDFDDHDGPLVEVVDRLTQIPLAFQPGIRWNYGVSSDVLGRVVEVVSGKSLDVFFKDRIFEPLKMVDTGFSVASEKIERLAALYEKTEDSDLTLLEAPQSSSFIDGVQTFSGGSGLMSTLGDYFRFAEMLRCKGELEGERLLGRKTVEYMTLNHLPGDLADMGQPVFSETSYEGIGFGLGVSVMLDPAKANVLGTPGEYAWGGYASTAFWVDPKEDMTVIFLTQLLPSSAYPIRRELRVLTYQALIDSSRNHTPYN